MTKSQTREAIIQHYQANPKVSVLVIGGGVNGIGVFRELALQGVDVLLVEKNDFCSGTSASSSHMAHGGLRYLENGEFRLVREAVAERNRLLANAPHYVKPLPTAVPVFSMLSGLWNAPLKFLGLLEKPAQRGAVVIKLGLLLYDYFTGTDRVVPAHTFLSKQRGLELIRGIAPALKYLAVYYDGAILSPERLCVEMLLDGEAYSANAKALNYVELAGANGRQVLLNDSLSGVEIKVEPQLVINAAGPWIDRANQILGHKTEFIGATKG
ncbi:MAG: FAD-dependent oxidoreductase, partial [Anaerolineae bacterium]|nr:FAD-dependent oxidoreductase [Anaerolineae bacterium]